MGSWVHSAHPRCASLATLCPPKIDPRDWTKYTSSLFSTYLALVETRCVKIDSLIFYLRTNVASLTILGDNFSN